MPDKAPHILFSNPREIEDKAGQLIALVRRGPPGPLVGPGEDRTWSGLLGPALLAKAAGTLESMMRVLPGRGTVDAFTLLRTLFENVVVFAWIAANPDTGVDAWYRSSAFRERKEHEDWMKAGMGLRTSEEAKELRAEAGTASQRLPDVPAMAAEADQAWGGRVPGWYSSSDARDPEAFSSARGLYRFVYQRGSCAAHSAARGLDPFMTEVDGVIRIGPERPTDDYMIYALGLYTLAFGIMASEQSLGWPCWREGARILERESDLFGE